MTTNPLIRYNYGVRAVIANIGWISQAEQTAIDALIENGVTSFIASNQELHLYWLLTADTMNDAIDEARTTLRRITEATGVVSPRTREIKVREISR